MKHFYFLIVIFSFSFFTFHLDEARAAEVGLGVTRNTFDLSIFPGDSYHGELTVFNKSRESALPFSARFSLWDLKEDSDDIEFVLAEPALNAAAWFEVENGPNFILDAAGARALQFRIAPPPDTPPGSYFVVMRLQAVLPDHYFSGEGPRVYPELGVLFFLRVPAFGLGEGADAYGVEIVSLKPRNTDPLGMFEIITPEAHAGVFTDIVHEVTAGLRNTGIYHFSATGSIEVYNMFGINVARAELPSRILLPGRTRDLNFEITDEEFSFFRKLAASGPHTVTLALNVPEQDEPVLAYLRFWVFPWKELGIVLFTLVLLVLLHRRVWRAGKALLGRS